MPRVSVDLCCYNSERYLSETLRSVLAQTYEDFELVVVDDGSRDGTESIVRPLLGGPRKIVYHRQANQGLGAARNKALELSSGEIIAIIDHDDVWSPSKLERLMRLFSRPEVGFASSDAMFMDSGGKDLARYSDRNALGRGRILEDLFLNNFIPCAGVMFRRSAIAAAGGFFRPDYGIAEEYDLFLRLAEVSEFDFDPEPLVRIRVHPGSAGWDVARERREMRQIYADCLARNPGLAERLGPRALSVKRAGFWLTRTQAEALRGAPAPASQRLRAELLWALSRLGPGPADLLLGLKRRVSRLRAALPILL